MLRSITVSMLTVWALAILLQTPAQAANDPVREGRSVAKACSPNAMVCAVSQDGSMQPTDECAARRAPAVRILPGDCFDPD